MMASRTHWVRISNISRQTNSDGIAITNPIDPKNDSHKFICFYYLLDDLLEILQSQMNPIGSSCICYITYLNKDTLN
jgi:hypothetical protein